MPEADIVGPDFTQARQRVAFTIERPWEKTEDWWVSTLQEWQGEFFYEGDLMGAATLLGSMAQGMKHRMDRMVDPDETVPLVIVDKAPLPIYYDITRREVCVDRVFLENSASLTFDPGEMKEKDGRVTFVGRLPDFFLLSGVAEIDHAEWFDDNPDTDTLMPHGISQAAYDAQSHELSALFAEKQVAIELTMLPATITYLQKRIDAAIAYQKEHGLQ